MQNVLVIFQATRPQTEGLALAFGLGAVQAGANIRLRHLDPSPSVELAHAGYGTLRLDDLRWAEGVGILLESPSPEGFEPLEQSLREIAGEGPVLNRHFCLFHPNPESKACQLLCSVLLDAGFRSFHADYHADQSAESMTAIGRQFAGLASVSS